jgi:hypothetical protein
MRNPCPVLTSSNAVLDSAAQLAKTMRQLRRSLRCCERCSSAEGCPTRLSLGGAIHTAIQEVTEEWHLNL